MLSPQYKVKKPFVPTGNIVIEYNIPPALISKR